MTKRTTETSAQAHKRLLKEAHKRLQLLEAAIVKAETATNVNWGHVGSLAEVVEKLGQAGHYAGVAELTEK